MAVPEVKNELCDKVHRLDIHSTFTNSTQEEGSAQKVRKQEKLLEGSQWIQSAFGKRKRQRACKAGNGNANSSDSEDDEVKNYEETDKNLATYGLTKSYISEQLLNAGFDMKSYTFDTYVKGPNQDDLDKIMDRDQIGRQSHLKALEQKRIDKVVQCILKDKKYSKYIRSQSAQPHVQDPLHQSAT